jgi:hypothetical protein
MHEPFPTEPPCASARLFQAANDLLDVFAEGNACDVRDTLSSDDRLRLAIALNLRPAELKEILQELRDAVAEYGVREPTSFGGSNPPLSAAVNTGDSPDLRPPADLTIAATTARAGAPRSRSVRWRESSARCRTKTPAELE